MKLLHYILLKVISILSKKPQIETSAQNMSLNNLWSFYNMNDCFMPSGILRKKKEQENLISTLFTKTWSLIPWDSFSKHFTDSQHFDILGYFIFSIPYVIVVWGAQW